MKRRLLLLVFCVLMFADSQVQGQICSKYKEFKCFWDGACIPNELKCNGKHDCVQGEDETAWFAGCNNCSDDEFHCHKEAFNLHCIDKDYACDGLPDCFNGEDEDYEFAKCKKKCRRNLKAAALAGRFKCRKPCKRDKDCKCKPGKNCESEKKCVCDYECGMSCVAVTKTCPPLPSIPHVRSIRYIRRNRETNSIEDAMQPFQYDVHAYHTCEPGYIAVPNEVRMCHGRGEKPWTKEIICARSCPPRNQSKVDEYKLSCGMNCVADADCAAGKTCTCDGACGRTCVDIEIECGEAPEVENAFIEYTGEKFDRVAHYICKEGTYTEGGDVSRKCTGSGKWDGKPIICARVTCADPMFSIVLMGGKVLNYLKPPYYYNTTFHFACGSGQRLLGSSTRTCMGDGRWSGYDTVCDNIGNLKRCPHPGIPIGGVLIGSRRDEDFLVGKTVQFQCNDGLVMIGDPEQKCLFYKEWSGDGAPLCLDPRYSDVPSDAINKLSASTWNIRPGPKFSKAGRTIRMDSRGGIEVYFLIDLSLSVGIGPLRNTINFAQRLVARLSQNDTSDRVNYGIIVFATTAQVVLNILDEPKKTPNEVIQILGEIESDVEKIRKKINQGTNIQGALTKLNERMISFSYQNDPDFIIKRHIFVLTDGAHNAGGSPSEARKDIERGYKDNPPEFYSITSSARDQSADVREELEKIASKRNNFIYVEDFYKLHKYVDEVTDVREDYDPCGQAGEVGSVRKIAYRGRTIGGDDAVERAWPWQALVMRFDENILAAFDSVMGGGSLINSRWVLSAAHVFEGESGDGWEQGIMVSLGIIRRPHRYNMLEGSVKIFQPEKIYLHNEFNVHNGQYMEGTFQNDIALIKLGGEFVISKNGRRLLFPESFPGFVEFSPYIRPVCLPCSNDSCVSKVLMKKDSEGKVLLKGDETPEEKCRIEYEFLMGKNDKSTVAVVATGFGHNATRTDEDDRPVRATRVLQQAVLRISERHECDNAVKVITRQKSIPGFKHIFTDQMFCAVGSTERNKKGINIVDTCKGDSGGPLTREVRDINTKESCFVQLGVVSWGYGCGQVTFVDGKRFFYPGFYADVTSAMSWIRSTMNEHEKKKKS